MSLYYYTLNIQLENTDEIGATLLQFFLLIFIFCA